jgi:hypothetical protein
MFKVTSLSIQNGLPNRGGTRVMALFDAHSQDIGLRQCSLVLHTDGRWKVWLPALGAAERRESRFYFRAGSAMHDELLAAAQSAYRLLRHEPAEMTQHAA